MTLRVCYPDNYSKFFHDLDSFRRALNLTTQIFHMEQIIHNQSFDHCMKSLRAIIAGEYGATTINLLIMYKNPKTRELAKILYLLGENK